MPLSSRTFDAWGLLVLVPLAVAWVASYFYMRQAHSLAGEYASAPLHWRQICYDKHYPGAEMLCVLHQPLRWFDETITGVETELRSYNFDGDPSNYGLEAYN